MKAKKPKRSRIKKTIGDVIEIPTSKGLAYVQYTHEHKDPPVYGSLVRILQGFYETTPSQEELENLVKNPHRFVQFCPVHHAVNMGGFRLVGNFPVPEFAKKFPVFKGTNALPKSDPEEAIWWLWDGEKEWKAGKLSAEELSKYPQDGVVNDTALIKRIETGEGIWGKLC